MSGDMEWNENLYDCCKDAGTCCYGYWCTPCLFGSNAEKIDNSNCCLMCCLYTVSASIYLCWLPHLMKRKKLREKYNLKENPSCGDCPTTLCCGPCALCQEARELKSREKQPNIGFKANAGDTPIVSQPGPDFNDHQVITERL